MAALKRIIQFDHSKKEKKEKKEEMEKHSRVSPLDSFLK